MTLGNQTVLIWMAFPDDVVVHYEVVEPGGGTERTLAQALVAAMQTPLVGEPRRPGRVRVASARDAREIRECVGAGVSLTQAPTPEIDFLLEQMNDFRARGAPDSWLDEVHELDVSGFFRAAAFLFSVAPWKTLDESCLVRVDAPELGLKGAVVSFLGHANREYGFLLFPSLEAHGAFLEGAQRSMARGEPVDLGTAWLALSYDKAAVCSPKLLSDIRARGLMVERGDAYPAPYSHGSDGKLLALTIHDVRALEAVARSLARFFDEFGSDMFDEDDPDDAVSVKSGGEGENDPLVELTAPFWAHDEDGWQDGSSEDEDSSAAQLLHEVDRELVAAILKYGRMVFGETWQQGVASLLGRHPMELVGDFLAYRQEVQGKTLAAHFAKEFSELSPLQREWLDSQSKSWLSTWEVVEVDVGVGLLLRDLLSGEERYVSEVGATETLEERLVILARVIDYQNISLLGVTHPQPLRPLDADRVVQAVKKRLRRKGEVPRERLMPSSIVELLMDEWGQVVSDVHARASMPPQLHNTDGDALLLTVDHFALVDPSARASIQVALASAEGIQAESDEVFVFLRPGEGAGADDDSDATLIARVVVADKELRVETNSIRRADDMRARVEAILGDEIRHRIRTHSDPVAHFDEMKARHERGTATPPAPLPPEAQAAVMQMKERFIRKWVDEPIPALGGKTPRQATQSADGKRQLAVLLREIELIESHSPDGLRLDLTPIRRELGL